MKRIIFRQRQTVLETINLVITEELYNKILDDMNCEPKVPYKDFYEYAIGNETFAPHVHYDYYLKEGHQYTSVDYYSDESYSGYEKPGLKRYYDSLDRAIKDYLETHPNLLPKPKRDVEGYTEKGFEVPDRETRYV